MKQPSFHWMKVIWLYFYEYCVKRRKSRALCGFPQLEWRGCLRTSCMAPQRAAVRHATGDTMDMLEHGKFGTAVPFKKRYGNYMGGEWVEPVDGQYFENITPVTGKPFCEVPRSTAADIERALDAAHAAKVAWGKTSTTERANILNRIADRMQDNLALLATAETWDNGKPIRET